MQPIRFSFKDSKKKKMNIAIISASVRTGRMSHRLALFFKNYIEEKELGNVELLDLYKYQFPVFEERLRNIKNPTNAMLEFANKIITADAVIIVTPEYNGGYPASLKNAIDLLYAEWKRKPVAIACVSNGPFGGSQVITSLVFSLWKIGALVVPAKYFVPNVQTAYDEDGHPANKEVTEGYAKAFIDELLWCAEANKKMSTGKELTAEVS
jgi:NAD(P)H-dependent FMN reductase